MQITSTMHAALFLWHQNVWLADVGKRLLGIYRECGTMRGWWERFVNFYKFFVLLQINFLKEFPELLNVISNFLITNRSLFMLPPPGCFKEVHAKLQRIALDTNWVRFVRRKHNSMLRGRNWQYPRPGGESPCNKCHQQQHFIKLDAIWQRHRKLAD